MNASEMSLGKFEFLTIHEIKQMIDVNIYHTGMLMRMLVSKFYKRASNGKKSAILSISSITGTQSTPGCIIYSATKAFTLFFTMASGYELKYRNFDS